MAGSTVSAVTFGARIVRGLKVRALLPPAQQHYLRDVLRLRPGEQIEVFDGEGRSWIGQLGRRGTAAAAVDLHGYAPPHSKGPGAKTYVFTVYALSAPVRPDVHLVCR